MRFTIVLLAASVWAQAPLKPVVPETPAEKPLLSFSVMQGVEKQLDERMSSTGGTEPIVVLGPARALYLAGYGAVMSQEVSLLISPLTVGPFHPKMLPAEVAQVHQRKVARLPLLRKTVQQMWADAASSLNMVPDSEQIVLAVRLLYKSWEDTSHLPGQIVLKGTRGGGPAGVQVEEQ